MWRCNSPTAEAVVSQQEFHHVTHFTDVLHGDCKAKGMFTHNITPPHFKHELHKLFISFTGPSSLFEGRDPSDETKFKKSELN